MSDDNPDCVSPGFGFGTYGVTPWDGARKGTPGGPLPAELPFDVYCVDSCGSITYLLTYSGVSFTGDSAQAFVDVPTNMMALASGGSYPTSLARVDYNTSIPLTFTFDAVVYLDKLPSNFANLKERHVFLGVTDAQGASAGLFLSRTGMLYTGAVHFVGDNVVLDNPSQALPDSDLLFELGESYSLRLAVSYETGTTYVYWTKTSDVKTLGYQLRYVLPVINSADSVVAPPDRTTISVRGTATDPSILGLAATCLGTGLLIPNLPPRADAGVDQAVRTCAIVQLDGGASFDPEGAQVLYSWRLLDAPLGSQYIFDGVDALTHPEATPTGFTHKVYSVDLQNLEAIDAIELGCALIVGGVPFTINGKGLDGNGFYVQLSTEIADSFSTSTAFKLLRQRGISHPTTQKPTFLPDKPGLYKFDLIVFDGDLYSLPSLTIINVTESPVPRGLIPDLRFLWGYLSDFWNLIEERERIEVFWSGLAQIAAAELLNLWQLDYSKSLRDIQRTFQRRWLRYDLAMNEDPVHLELTSVRAIFGGFLSSNISAAGIPASVLQLVIGTTVYPINVSVPARATAGDVADLFVALLQPQLDIIDKSIVVTAVKPQGGAGVKVRLNAPFAFSVNSTSTCTLFPFASNTYPQGNGSRLGDRTYRIDKSLVGVDVQDNDFLVLDSGAYRIARVSTDAADAYGMQRITTVDLLPTDAPSTWSIGGIAKAQTLDFWYGAVVDGDVVHLDVVNLTTGEILSVAARALGANPFVRNQLAFDASAVGSYLLDPSFAVYVRGVLRRNYIPVDRLVQDVPYLQEKINSTDDKQVLRRNVDYFLESFRGVKVLRFIVGTPDVWQGVDPPRRLWAETTYLDNRPMIEANFGLPAAFTLDDLSKLPSNIDYLSAVRGLWYSYFNGPTLFNLRAGVQILLGLPFAEEAGTIEEIRDDFSSTTGRILVRDTKDTEIVRSYTFPTTLELETNVATGVPYTVGDAVAQFAPLVRGAEVIDWVKDPKWIEGYINQGTRFEVEKFFNFLVRVNADAFNLSALLFAQSFIKRIKPTYTHPIFIVQRRVALTDVSVSDNVTYRGKLAMFVGPDFGPTGQAQMWDQARPSGGGYWNQYDTADPNAPPTYPTGTSPTAWVFGQYDLAPEEAILATIRQIWAGGVPTSDGIFYADMPVFTRIVGALITGGLLNIPVSPGAVIGTPITSSVTATINKAVLMFRGVGDGQALNAQLFKNGVAAGTLSFVIPYFNGNEDAPQWKFQFNVAIAVVPGDVLTAKLYHPTGFNTFVDSIGICLGVGQDWLADTALAANTYQFCLPI